MQWSADQGCTTIAINNFVIIVEQSEENAAGMRKRRVLLRATPLGSLQWEQLSVLSLFLSVPSAFWQPHTAGMWGCSVLLFAGLLGCERLVPGCCWPFSSGQDGPHCTALHCAAQHNSTAMQCNAMHWPIVVSAALGGKRSRSLAPQQGTAAPSCVRRWWLPDGGWRERRRGPVLSLSLFSLHPLCLFLYFYFSCLFSPLLSCKIL